MNELYNLCQWNTNNSPIDGIMINKSQNMRQIWERKCMVVWEIATFLQSKTTSEW